MDAHASPTTAAAEEHDHPSAGTYVKIGIVLFVLTALEVGAYEIAHREGLPLHDFLHTALIPVLIVLSAIKFALVALFYMHLKQDHRLFTGVFVFPLIIATVIILALIVLEAYHFAFARSG